MIEMCNCCTQKCNVRMIKGKLYDIDDSITIFEKEFNEKDNSTHFVKTSIAYLMDSKIKNDEEKEIFARLIEKIFDNEGTKYKLLKTRNNNYFLAINNQITGTLTLEEAKDYLYENDKTLFESEFGSIEYA